MKCDQYPCKYCFTSCAIKRKRTTFKPDELATTFVALNRERRVDGLFLSSGIVPDADTTMEKMLTTVERLRLKEGYTGYIHLKLIPGASFEYIERAVELADRVSLNLEAPNQARLNDLAPDKEFAGNMWGRMAWAAELMKRARQEGRQAARSLTTQFVVGAVGESDREQAFAASLDAFTQQRTRLLAVLEPLTPEGWERAAMVMVAGQPLERTARFYVEWLATHERSHLKSIEFNVRALRA